IQINASADFSYASSKEESNKLDTKSSKEIVNKAISSISSRKRTQNTVRTLRETEDTTVHGFTNVPGTDHIAGVYRWVDKYYLAQVKNYGKHVMLDFVVPEPAAFFLFSRLHRKAEDLVKDRPSFPQVYDPSDPSSDPDGYRDIRSFHDVSSDNYSLLAAQYAAVIALYPEQYKKIAKTFASAAPAQGGAVNDVT